MGIRAGDVKWDQAVCEEETLADGGDWGRPCAREREGLGAELGGSKEGGDGPYQI